jgi:predicted dinucleotide-binding enzyme
MTTAIIGAGGIGSAIARELASGGEILRLASADHESARTLAAKIGRGAVAAVDNRDALPDVDAVILALRFTVLRDVIAEIADQLAGKLVVVPSNPVSADAQGNVSRHPNGRLRAGAGGRARPVGSARAGRRPPRTRRRPRPGPLIDCRGLVASPP